MRRRNKNKECEVALEPLRRRLERWRSGANGQRRRIPEDIWKESARAARQYGLSAVAQMLRLDYYNLKSRRDGFTGVKRSVEKAPTFVELLSAPKNHRTNAIELQKAGGSKLRIEFEGELTRQLSLLSERLWRAAR